MKVKITELRFNFIPAPDYRARGEGQFDYAQVGYPISGGNGYDRLDKGSKIEYVHAPNKTNESFVVYLESGDLIQVFNPNMVFYHPVEVKND